MTAEIIKKNFHENLEVSKVSIGDLLSQIELATQKAINLTKELATVERALEQADKNVQKIGTDLDNLEHAKCYACGQELHDEKLKEMRNSIQADYGDAHTYICLLYTSPSPRDQRGSRMPSSA